MSTFTETYGLIKPDEADYYDIADWNENMDTLDDALAAQDRAAAEISEKIGTPATEGATLFRLLEESGGGLIKSIQSVELAFKTDNSASAQINTVDPARCFVQMDRLCDGSGYISKLTYTLQANSISVTSKTNLTGTADMLVRFQIIEFY